MTTLSPADAELFREAVRGALRRAWPSATSADPEYSGSSGLDDVSGLAAEQGWLELAGEPTLEPMLVVAAELGRVACPAPLVDGFVAAALLGAAGDQADAVRAARIRPLVADDAAGEDRLRYLEGAGAATHVLLLRRHEARAVLAELLDEEAEPGVAMPSWAAARAGAVVAEVGATPEELEDAARLMRLGLVVRAVAAAERAAELALEHAKARHAFGKPIGAFQAVSHRCADSAIDVTAFRRLVREAVRLHDTGDPAWRLASDLAVTWGRRVAPRVQFRSHHTLAAIGFFEEHEAPWLFRRAQADVARVALFPSAGGSVADVLLETGAALPRLDLGERGEAFRLDVRRMLAEHPATVEPWSLEPDEAFTRALAERGWLAMTFPPRHGGRDAEADELTALMEELGYAGADSLAVSATLLIGGAIHRHGTDDQQARFLPLIGEGRLPYYLGYSEPEVGSDLAALRTTARRDGDEWVIDGQKLWGTGAHRARWVWLAARTDPDAVPPHAGITVFLFEVPREGWECRQHRGLSGEISCTTFFDGVRVPDSARIGEENGGWKVITDALASERVVMGSVSAGVHRLFDELVAELRRHPDVAGPRGSAVRARVEELAAKLQATRALVNASVRATNVGGGAGLEAPMAKITGAELYQDVCEAAVEILGPRALLAGGDGVPGGGGFGYGLRMSIMYVVGGGTNDIGRNLIARSLGLPR